MKNFFIVSLTLVMTLFMLSCSSKENTKTGSAMKNELKGAPDWVLGGASSKDKICGVGSAAGTRNPSLARTAAIGRGRTAISRTLETQVNSMLKDYQATTTGGENFGNAANDEQHIVDVSKQITQNTISGAEQNKTWIADTGTLYVLVCVDVEKFKDSVNKMSQLNEAVREAVVERADKAFEELDKETSK